MKKSQHCFAVAKVPVKAIAMAIILAHGTEVHARELHVCPDTAPDCQSIYSFDWAGVNADDKVVLHGGIYSQPIVISNVASGAEIVPGEGDVYINGMVAFVNSKYVRWNGNQRIHIQDTDSPGIAIVQGSAHLAIAGTDISNTGLGIWIAQGAGCGHYLFSNTIKNNQTHGIAVDKINCRADNRTQIFENTIIENHYHGIELNGNYYNVIANRVARNGGGAVGTNGIHVVSGNPSEGTGQYNEIRSNIVHENADIDLNGADGSGIKLDRYTRFNTVSDNVIFKNEGAGIMVYDSHDATLGNNLLYSNVTKRGSPDVVYPKCCLRRGQITVASTQPAFPETDESDYSNHIFISDNLIYNFVSDPGGSPPNISLYALPEPISVDPNTVVNDTIIGTPIDKSQRIYTTDLDYADQDTGDISVSLKGNMIWRVTFVQEVPW